MGEGRALLEREGELAAISAALGAAAAGEGGIVAIEGKAGLGKTSLLREARRLATEAEVQVLSGRATELEREFPFAVLRQMLGPRLRRCSPGEQEALFEGAVEARGALGFETDADHSPDTFSVLHGLYWVLAGLADPGPLLLMLDDVHLADPASLDWLAFVSPRLDELSVLLLLAQRTDEAENARLTGILADPSVETIAPEPLSAPATASVIEATLGRQAEEPFAKVCHEITGGNPFLVTELARELAGRKIEPRADQADSARVLAPRRVAQMVLTRISRLPPAAEALGQSVAILGDGSELALTVELAGLDPRAGREAADALRRAAILDAGETLRFVHPLVRNAIYADLTAGERGQAHAAAAALLRDKGAPPGSVATQILASEPLGDPTSVETMLEAARRGLADGAPGSAVSYLMRALREPPPSDSRIEVLKMLLSAAILAADHAALATVVPELRAVLAHEPSSARSLVIPLTMGMILAGRFEEAADVLKDAADTAIAEGDVESAFRFEAQLRTVGVIIPSVPEVDLRKYLVDAEPDSPAGRLAAAIEARSAAVNGTAQEAADAARRALGNGGAIFEEESEIAAAMVAVLILVIADEPEAAREAIDRALEIARNRNAAPDLSRSFYLSGFAAWAEGDLVAAEADLHQAVEVARLAGIVPLVLTSSAPLAEVMIERDELEAADAVFEAAGAAAGPIPVNALFSPLLTVRGHLRFERGQFAEAIDDFEALFRLSESLGFGPGPKIMIGPYACRALVALGRSDEARDLADSCLYYARRWGAPGGIAHVLRGVAAARGGEEEIELLREAVAMVEDMPRRLPHIYALVDLGAALRRQNRRAEARAPLREGLELSRRSGAVRLARRARSELQATGETVRNYAPIGVESLTPSERRVAEMAASGMTNREIAQSLFVTLKTVEAHLSAAYDKLDISSRRQLGGVLSQHDR